MYILSPVTLDLPLRLLTVHHNGKEITLTDHTIPREKCVLEPDEMTKLMEKSVLGYIIQIHALECDDNSGSCPVPTEIETLVGSAA